jgi:cytochrome c peroxidase
MRSLIATLLLTIATLGAHDAHGRANAPLEARRLRNPLTSFPPDTAAVFNTHCATCHGADGRARKQNATNLANHLMESMRDGEIFWVAKHGIPRLMPAFGDKLNDTTLWQLTLYVRDLRARERTRERAALGDYDWQLPPGFPYPKVPADNLMSPARVSLGRYLFYDKRLSLNQTQSCASCHRQHLAFTDGKPRGIGSTGQRHPRGSMSLINVAYQPVLTWANPLMRQLEQQAAVPLFGDHPVELGMAGKEDLLIARLRQLPVYRKLFAAAFPEDNSPFTISNVAKAIAAFERTLIAGDSPYDEYRRGDDPNAISAAAKRGEALFFSERLECFHCHGGFNFTGTVEYYGKSFVEVEFHNTGLYTTYPEPNVGLFEFTRQPDDHGKFKAPTLRNIAVTAPYMHDGSIRTLEEAITHYARGGRADHPNKSEFIKPIDLTPAERRDLIAFLHSLTDKSALTNPAWSNPWLPRPKISPPPPGHPIHGQVVHVYPEEGMVGLHHEEVPGFMAAMKAPLVMEFLVPDREFLARLKPGMTIHATVRKRGSDYLLLPPRRTTKQ